jgi:hypothetical protein
MMTYTQQDVELAAKVHGCDNQTAIDQGYAQAVADSRAEEKRFYQLIDLRNKRNQLLAESDWTQNEDIPQALRDAWKPYRQALRDITDTYTSLEDAVWPTKP